MKNQISFLLCCLLLTLTVRAQRLPDGGGSYGPNAAADEMSPAQRQIIIKELQTSERQLRQAGKLPPERTTATLFQWPVVQAPGFADNGFYGISNYVDENPAFPNQVKDYNCGTRSYDLSSGYNHQGTDIFLWPFPWKKMQQNAVLAVAAAPGIILGKIDGNNDQSCAFCTGPCSWNAVYIKHADGSVAWYGHLKTASLTSKAIGEQVALGEYLGVVGSSGNSTAPHLHFEVYTNSTYTKLVDPWAGPCNLLNGNTSWWAAQQPYIVPTLNKIMTHGAAPGLTNCPAGEAVNEKINFVSGDKLYMGSYYRDQQAGHQAVHTLYKPDGTVYNTWVQNFANSYTASWWYYVNTLPLQAPKGMWRYSVSYLGRPELSVYFAVNVNGYVFTGNGVWSDAHNWANEAMPPMTVSDGTEIMINPVDGGECIIDNPLQLNPGAKISIAPGKKMRQQ